MRVRAIECRIWQAHQSGITLRTLQQHEISVVNGGNGVVGIIVAAAGAAMQAGYDLGVKIGQAFSESGSEDVESEPDYNPNTHNGNTNP